MRSPCPRSRIKNETTTITSDETGQRFRSVGGGLGSSGIRPTGEFQNERSATMVATRCAVAPESTVYKGRDSTRSMRAFVAAFLNQLATTKRTSRPSDQPGHHSATGVPVAPGLPSHYRRGARAPAIVVQLSNDGFCDRNRNTPRRVFPSY